MKDFLDRRLAEENARKELQRTLRASWLALGHAEETWQLPCGEGANQHDRQEAKHKQKGAFELYSRIAKDVHQKKAVDAIEAKVRNGVDAFFHQWSNGKREIHDSHILDTERGKHEQIRGQHGNYRHCRSPTPQWSHCALHMQDTSC